MKQDGDKFILTTIELAAFVSASIERATKILHAPDYDPNEDATPYIVNQGYKLLYGSPLYQPEELQQRKVD